MPTQTITVKLRDLRTTPPPTRLFTLPAARVAQTSAYYRHQLASPLTRHQDGIFRLNFPDFDIFAIYVEWLSSDDIFTKAAFRQLKGSDTPRRSSQRKSPADKARAAYTDYLGAYFLGIWIQDTTFKDALVSIMVSKMNSEDGEGYPREFIKALSPNLVDLIFMERREGAELIKQLIFAAIVRFAEKEDVEAFIAEDGKEQYPFEFTRSLMVFLWEASKETQFQRASSDPKSSGSSQTVSSAQDTIPTASGYSSTLTNTSTETDTTDPGYTSPRSLRRDPQPFDEIFVGLYLCDNHDYFSIVNLMAGEII
ncbi:hypothetical protein BS50DRAFT_635412 [Corynespora cassiicola Philippines]|uniref:Uncharacterized protein n=1 Tax=Corynespora cassiicola Philippines TaxID=1448308 RepID=A0A2T2NMJ0_CORCC|nr:hypothetical protein BS50DRAFT_635412 [Corynespora cassiicola Philippines]